LSEKQSKYNNIFTIVLNVILVMFGYVGYDKKVCIKFQCLILKIIGLNVTQECNL